MTMTPSCFTPWWIYRIRVPTHFQTPFSTLFQYLSSKWKNLTPSLMSIFPKFYSWNTMQTRFANLSSAVKNKIWINKWLNLVFPYFFNTLCTFWPNSILFQGLQKRFHNSIRFQYCVGTLGNEEDLTSLLILSAFHPWELLADFRTEDA